MSIALRCDACNQGLRAYVLRQCDHVLCASCVNGNLSRDVVAVHMMAVECSLCKVSTTFDVKTGLPFYVDRQARIAIQYMQAYQ